MTNGRTGLCYPRLCVEVHLLSRSLAVKLNGGEIRWVLSSGRPLRPPLSLRRHQPSLALRRHLLTIGVQPVEREHACPRWIPERVHSLGLRILGLAYSTAAHKHAAAGCCHLPAV